MGLLSCMDQVMLLQVGQLSEALIACLTLKRALATVDTQVHLRIAQKGSKVRDSVPFITGGVCV